MQQELQLLGLLCGGKKEEKVKCMIEDSNQRTFPISHHQTLPHEQDWALIISMKRYKPRGMLCKKHLSSM